MSDAPRRVTTALPFTVIPEPDCVRLLGGEDVRFTLRAPYIDGWLPPLFDALSAPRPPPVAEVLARVPAAHRDAARALVERLVSERVLVDAPPRLGPAPQPQLAVEVVGAGSLAESIRAAAPGSGDTTGGATLRVLAQETLDHAEALAFDRAARRDALAEGPGAPRAWLWATTGPVARALVSPVFLADGGPCVGCLLAAFRRLSPAPELHDALLAHAAHGGAFARAPAPPEALAIVASLVAWKARALAADEQPAAPYELHALELATFTVSAHPVPLDPDCAGAHAS